MKYYILECTDRKSMKYRVIDVTENKHEGFKLCEGLIWRNYMSEHDYNQMSKMELKRKDSQEMVKAIERYKEDTK